MITLAVFIGLCDHDRDEPASLAPQSGTSRRENVLNKRSMMNTGTLPDLYHIGFVLKINLVKMIMDLEGGPGQSFAQLA